MKYRPLNISILKLYFPDLKISELRKLTQEEIAELANLAYENLPAHETIER